MPVNRSDANVPAKMMPAAATVGAPWAMAMLTASAGSLPERSSSRTLAVIRML